MKTYTVIAKIVGDASVEVQAESKAEAIDKARHSDKWTIDDWDLNTQSYAGGSIDAIEED